MYAHFQGEIWAVAQPHQGTSVESLGKKSGTYIHYTTNCNQHRTTLKAFTELMHSGRFRVARVRNVRAGRMAARIVFVNTYKIGSRSQMD